MAWATAGNIVVTNLDAGTDSPASARADLKAALDELTIVSNNLGTTDGAAKIESDGVIRASVTGVSTASGDLTLTSATSKVVINDIINLTPKTKAELDALTSAGSTTNGDVAVCSNGNAGAQCLAIHNGTAWLKFDGGALSTS